MWLALTLKKTVTVSILGCEAETPFSNMADGCCGVCLVFNSKEEAAQYAGPGGGVVQIEETTRSES